VENASAFSFDRSVLRADVPVVVDFWAPWCIVCRELEAPLAELAAEFAGRARVVRVNIDWSSRVARRFDVTALPTILIFKGGELVSRSSGAASKQDLEELLAAQLAPAVVAAVAPTVAAALPAGPTAAGAGGGR
jgi:thioredoxin 1